MTFPLCGVFISCFLCEQRLVSAAHAHRQMENDKHCETRRCDIRRGKGRKGDRAVPSGVYECGVCLEDGVTQTLIFLLVFSLMKCC